MTQSLQPWRMAKFLPSAEVLASAQPRTAVQTRAIGLGSRHPEGHSAAVPGVQMATSERHWHEKAVEVRLPVRIFSIEDPIFSVLARQRSLDRNGPGIAGDEIIVLVSARDLIGR
jgi:hypothetical protein